MLKNYRTFLLGVDVYGKVTRKLLDAFTKQNYTQYRYVNIFFLNLF